MSTTRAETRNSPRDSRRTFSVSKTSARQPHVLTCKLFSVAVWEKAFRECLLITPIKLSEAKFSNEATTQHTPSSRQTEIRSLKGFFCRQMFRLSSSFSQELDDAVPHSQWLQRSACVDAFSNPDQQPPAAEHQLHNCISKEHDKQQALPRKELYHIHRVTCEERLVSLHISGCRWTTCTVFSFQCSPYPQTYHVSDALPNH